MLGFRNDRTKIGSNLTASNAKQSEKLEDYDISPELKQKIDAKKNRIMNEIMEAGYPEIERVIDQIPDVKAKLEELYQNGASEEDVRNEILNIYKNAGIDLTDNGVANTMTQIRDRILNVSENSENNSLDDLEISSDDFSINSDISQNESNDSAFDNNSENEQQDVISQQNTSNNVSVEQSFSDNQSIDSILQNIGDLNTEIQENQSGSLDISSNQAQSGQSITMDDLANIPDLSADEHLESQNNQNYDQPQSTSALQENNNQNTTSTENKGGFLDKIVSQKLAQKITNTYNQNYSNKEEFRGSTQNMPSSNKAPKLTDLGGDHLQSNNSFESQDVSLNSGQTSFNKVHHESDSSINLSQGSFGLKNQNLEVLIKSCVESWIEKNISNDSLMKMIERIVEQKINNYFN